MYNKKSGKTFLGIKNKIIIAFICFLIFPIFVLSAISMGNINFLGNRVAEISGNSLKFEEYRSIEEITETKASYIEEIFTQVSNDIKGLAKYTEDLFNGRFSFNFRESYFHNDTTPGYSPPDLFFDENEYGRLISYDYSCYVFPWENTVGKSHYTMQNSSINATIETSTHLDVIFRQMKEITPEYAWIYVGFDIGMHRSYPWHSYSSNYDPRIRPWYQKAVENKGSVVFTSPYIDASGRGLMISTAKAVYYDNGTLIGVCSSDLTIEFMQQNILNTKILDSGYAFLLDNTGNAVTHPNISMINTPITDLESYGVDFNEILEKIVTGVSGNGTYLKGIKPNSDSWLISYRFIPVTNYSLCIVVPEKELIAPAINIQSHLLYLVKVEFWIFALILLISVGIIGFVGNSVSKRIVNPIVRLTKMMNFISEGDVTREIPFGSENNIDEITYLTATFKNLITILRLGNEDYYRGDLEKAFSNYSQALRIFELSENYHGIGVCKNNLGNIFRIRGDYERANIMYHEAIDNAKYLGNHLSLAKRMNNLAQLFADCKQYKKASQSFQAAFKIYDEKNILDGKAQIYRNHGFMVALNGDTEDGKDLILKALRIDNNNNKGLGKAYDYFFLGKIYSNNKEIGPAIENLEYAENLASKSEDKRLLMNIYKEFKNIYREKQDSSILNLYDQKYNELRISEMQSKFIVFVIDVSGSMQGLRIKEAVKGALEIYDNLIYPQDTVSVVLFHSVSSVILPPTKKLGNEEFIRSRIKRIQTTPYFTAFFDAIGDSFSILNQAVGNDHKWIIALTDGLDNSSHKFSLEDRKFKGLLKFLNFNNRIGLGEFIDDNLLNINLIIIGIGKEISQIESKIKALTDRNNQGKYIPIREYHNIESQIEKAFKKISHLLAQINVESFIPE